MPASECANKWNERYFSVSMKTQKMNMQESKERKFEKKVREIGWAVETYSWICISVLTSTQYL